MIKRTQEEVRDLRHLKKLVIKTQEEMHGYLEGYLSKTYGHDKVHAKEDAYIYVEGDIPVLLCAHMDTVHRVQPVEASIYWDSQKNALWSPDGIGADDRAGIFNIIRLIDAGYRPNVLFTHDEEIGGVGASKFVSDVLGGKKRYLEKRVRQSGFAIQFDRHGFSEAVYYDLDSEMFEEYISSFGYETQIGSFTDISTICPAFGFAGVNVAAGYTDEHTNHEILHIDEMNATYDKVENILLDNIESPKSWEYVATEFGGGWGYGYDSYYEDDYWTGYGYGSYKKGKKSTANDSFWDDKSNLDDLDLDPYTSDYIPSRRKKVVDTCEYCLIDRTTTNWTDSEDPSEDGLCDECKESFRKDREEDYYRAKEILKTEYKGKKHI